MDRRLNGGMKIRREISLVFFIIGGWVDFDLILFVVFFSTLYF